jgi:hypothetical protein
MSQLVPIQPGSHVPHVYPVAPTVMHPLMLLTQGSGVHAMFTVPLELELALELTLAVEVTLVLVLEVAVVPPVPLVLEVAVVPPVPLVLEVAVVLPMPPIPPVPVLDDVPVPPVPVLDEVPVPPVPVLDDVPMPPIPLELLDEVDFAVPLLDEVDFPVPLEWLDEAGMPPVPLPPPLPMVAGEEPQPAATRPSATMGNAAERCGDDLRMFISLLRVGGVRAARFGPKDDGCQ